MNSNTIFHVKLIKQILHRHGEPRRGLAIQIAFFLDPTLPMAARDDGKEKTLS